MVYFLCKAYDSDRQNCYFALSLPVRGAWIEMPSYSSRIICISSRSPCGERGLKWVRNRVCYIPIRSLPVRGAWIEINSSLAYAVTHTPSLPVRGAWIEISADGVQHRNRACRSPCGERGLKCKMAILSIQFRARRSPCGERGLKCSTRRARARGPCRSPCGERGLK